LIHYQASYNIKRMGLFDIFKKKETVTNAPAPKSVEESVKAGKGIAPDTTIVNEIPADASTESSKEQQDGYFGDLEKTAQLHTLVLVPREERDEQWVREFLAHLPLASMICGTPQVIAGPDGFPYFKLSLPKPNEVFQCFVIDHMKDDFLLERGYGVVINADEGQPDWVLSYGDILNYHLTGDFFIPDALLSNQSEQDEVIAGEEQVMIGQPSETYLPVETRKLLREFFQLNGIPDPKVLLMMRTQQEEASQELVFNITPTQFDDEEQFRNMMRTVTWYLPRHYIITGMNEGAVNGFLPL